MEWALGTDYSSCSSRHSNLQIIDIVLSFIFILDTIVSVSKTYAFN